MELMPQWEVDLRGTFRNRVTVERYQTNVVSLHKAIENFTGDTYTPPKKPLYDKILDVLKYHDDGTIFDARTMQLHLYFFHKKNYSRSHISKVLKKVAALGSLVETSRGVYKKVGK
jgi:uncharacterized protein YpbB